MTDPSYKNYVAELISQAEGASIRPMMGEYLVYCKGKVVGDICDNRLLIKPTPKVKELLPNASYELPYEGAKPMLLVEEEDPAFLKMLLETAADELPAKKPRGEKKK